MVHHAKVAREGRSQSGTVWLEVLKGKVPVWGNIGCS